MLDTPQPYRLRCAECGRGSNEQAEGWRALVLSGDDEHPLQEDAVAAFCSVCWEREFGE